MSYIAGSYLSEDDEIGVTCSVEVSGTWKPGLTCEVAGSRLDMNYTSSSISDLTAGFRGRARKTFHDSSIICKVQFNATARPKPASPLKVANNTPVYGPQWTSDALQVRCKYDVIR